MCCYTKLRVLTGVSARSAARAYQRETDVLGRELIDSMEAPGACAQVYTTSLYMSLLIAYVLLIIVAAVPVWCQLSKLPWSYDTV
jgi:hypothetical protein